MPSEPEDTAAHYNLGKALLEKGELDGAITEFQEVLRLNPNDDDAHYCLGAAFGRKGRRWCNRGVP